MRSRFRQFSLVALLGLVASLPAEADAPDLYSDTLSRIDSLYLRRADLVAEDLFAEAAQQLEDDVEWLMADREGTSVTLRVGDGEVLGTVTVGGWNSLERSLRELEDLTQSAARPIDEDLDLRVVLLKGATNALDRHSRLLYGEQVKAFDKRLKGTFFGIGARIARHDTDNEIYLQEVFENNPASRAGLQDGDVLLRIDGSSTVGMTVTDAVDHITGRKGTDVELVVRRTVEGNPVELTFVVTRDEIKDPNVEWKDLGDGFGYLRIDHFSELTEANLSRALIDLDSRGALERGLVIDLRDNTGGSMLQSARAADAFLTSGDLVRTVGRDGGKVRGLVPHIWAEDAGIEPTVPIVVLQNHRTASGSEILAGALRELDRAALIGTRTYGKGTVQKLYTMEPGTRLKLTVAEYLLAGGLSIHDEDGVAADLPVGGVLFSEDGVEVRDDRAEDGGPEPLLFVDESAGWRDAEPPPEREDLWVDLAVRVLATSRGSERGDVLEAAGEIRELVRAEEEQRLISTFAARGIDWAPAETTGPEPRVRLDVHTEEALVAGSSTQLIAEVTNLGDEPLHRVLVRLDAADSVWDRRVLPIGVLLPGQTKTGEATVQVRASAPARESSVSATVESDRHPDAEIGAFILGYDGVERPRLALDLALVKGEDGEYVRVEVENTSRQPLMQLHVRFEYPESTGIELAEYDAIIPALDDSETRVVHLGLDLSETPLEELPLHVIVETPRFGEVADYAFQLPRDGRSTHLQAPALDVASPLSMPAGEFTLDVNVIDDAAIDHVIVWAEGDKIAYHSGEGRRVDLSVPLEVQPGRNRYVVEAIDDIGLRSRDVVYVRGTGEGAVTQPEE
ncbi:MAG TPA: S41 family peptidase [Myxococcota bacterium]|nr:S41 family peptidase [Myxococcota bacterium]